jgi:REP element-mobilizing transposase RayT
MSNHVHLIASAGKGILLPDIIRDFKKYTSKQIEQAIRENPFESRKEWMLWIACPAKLAGFNRAGQRNSNNKNFQLWQQDNHLFELYGNDMLQQKLLYLHDNPVRAGLVPIAIGMKHGITNTVAQPTIALVRSVRFEAFVVLLPDAVLLSIMI